MNFFKNINSKNKIGKQIPLEKSDVGILSYEHVIDVRVGNVKINNVKVQDCNIDMFPLCICFIKSKLTPVKKIEDWRDLDTLDLEGQEITMIFKGSSTYSNVTSDNELRVYNISLNAETSEYYNFIFKFCNSTMTENDFPLHARTHPYYKKYSRPDLILTNSFYRQNLNVTANGLQLQKIISYHPDSFNFKKNRKLIEHLEPLLNAIEVSRTIKEITIDTNSDKIAFENFISKTKNIKKVIFELPQNEEFSYNLKNVALKEIEIISPKLTLDNVRKLLKTSCSSRCGLSLIFTGCLDDNVINNLLPIDSFESSITSITFNKIKCSSSKLVWLFSNSALNEIGVNEMGFSIDDMMYILSNTKAGSMSFKGLNATHKPKKSFHIIREVKRINLANSSWTSETLLNVLNGICNYQISDISIDLSDPKMSSNEWQSFYSKVLEYKSPYVIGLSLNNIINTDKNLIKFSMNFPRLFKLELKSVLRQDTNLVYDIIDLLKTTKSLDYLDVSDNGLTTDKFQDLLEAATANQTLLTFLFQGHNCSSAKPIVRLIANNPRLLRISFDSHSLSLTEARTIVAEVLRNKRYVKLDWPIEIASKAGINFSEVASLFEAFFEARDLPKVQPPEGQRTLQKVTRPQYRRDGRIFRRVSELGGADKKKLDGRHKEPKSLGFVSPPAKKKKKEAIDIAPPDYGIDLDSDDDHPKPEFEDDKDKDERHPIFVGTTIDVKPNLVESTFNLDADISEEMEKLEIFSEGAARVSKTMDKSKMGDRKYSLKWSTCLASIETKELTPSEEANKKIVSTIEDHGINLETTPSSTFNLEEDYAKNDEEENKDVWMTYKFKSDDTVKLAAPMLEDPPKEFFMKEFEEYYAKIC